MEQLANIDGYELFFQGDWPSYKEADKLVLSKCGIHVSAEYGEQHHDQMAECFDIHKMSLASLERARNVIEGLGGRQALYGMYHALPALFDAVHLSLPIVIIDAIIEQFKKALLMHVKLAWKLV